ncbi:MAG: hypothetical protein JSS10_06695 [Verrucomicrobia bacterium]|nr:hypothetical protein [Verrucomicrobiota bacterium]
MKYLMSLLVLFFSGVYADDYEEGIRSLKNKEYKKASQHFEKAAPMHHKLPSPHFGKALCEVALGHYDKVAQEMEKAHQMLGVLSNAENLDLTPQTPEEQISAYQCRQKVRKASQKLRLFVERMVADSVPGFFQKIQMFRQLNPYIDSLERSGLLCCQSGNTAECCREPLVRQLELWNSEGLSVESNSN